VSVKFLIITTYSSVYELNQFFFYLEIEILNMFSVKHNAVVRGIVIERKNLRHHFKIFNTVIYQILICQLLAFNVI